MTGRPPELGQPIPGYEVLELLGSGGMSSVYRARQRGLDRLVAVKVIRRDRLDRGTALDRLTKEAKVLARLDHPAIVRSIDFGETDELVYFVMELVEGKSSKQLLVERGRVPLRDVLVIAEQVATALGHAAAHGVTHRDVKPGNILLGRDGSVKLSDFGLARATLDRSLTKEGITVGTPQYMAPEQVKSPKRVDLRSDLYSLGATLYHLATGEAPFTGESVGEILHQVLYGSPRPPEQSIADFPPSFSRVLARLLAKDPGRRYPDVAALLADLALVRAAVAAGDDSKASAAGLSWQESAARPPRVSRPVLLLVAAAVVLGAMVPLLFGLLFGDGPPAGDPFSAAKSREERVLGELATALDAGQRGAAEVLAQLELLRRDGTLTAASSVARGELALRAQTAFGVEVEAAQGRARELARSQLARGDVGGARAAFTQAFAAGRAALLPEAVRATALAAEEPLDEVVRRAEKVELARLDELEQRLRDAVRRARTELRDRAEREIGDAHERLELAAVLRTIDGYAAEQRAVALTATRREFAAAGLPLAADLTDAELEAAWPRAVDEELRRPPVAEIVATWREEFAQRLDRRTGEAVAQVAAARDRDIATIESSAGPVDPAARARELRESLAPLLAALLTAGRPVEPLEQALADYAAIVGATHAAIVARAGQDALVRLLEGSEGEPAMEGAPQTPQHSGLDLLLAERRVNDARGRLAAAVGLAPPATAAWRQAVDAVADALDAARAGLKSRVGSEVSLRDRRAGVGIRGRLGLAATGDRFTLGPRADLRVEELDLPSVAEWALPEGGPPEQEVVVRFYLGEPKDRAEVDRLLAELGAGVVTDHLRELRERERSSVAAHRDAREAAAQALDAKVRTAFREGRMDDADAALEALLRLRETAAGKAALRERDALRRAIADGRKDVRQQQRLLALAPHATERAIDPAGEVTLVYPFDDAAEGQDFAITGNAVRVENGRLRFDGGDAGRVDATFGPILPFALDRKAAATLVLDLFVPAEPQAAATDRAPRSYFGVRLGGLCVGFLQVESPARDPLPPQLAAWMGHLGDYKLRFAEAALGVSEPALGRTVAVGLDRGHRYQLEVRYLPAGNGTKASAEILLDGARVERIEAAMETPPEEDALELRTLGPLHVEKLAFRGRMRP